MRLEGLDEASTIGEKGLVMFCMGLWPKGILGSK